MGLVIEKLPGADAPKEDLLSYEPASKSTHRVTSREPNPGPADRDTMGRRLAELHPAAFGWALACCRRNRTLAEEVTQMAYLKVLAGEARFDGRSSLKTWLFGVIRHTAAAERRKAWLTLSGLTRFARLQSASPTALSEAEAAGDTKQLLRALERLSRRQREVLHLVFYQDLTLESAAAVLCITLGAARVHYDRGKKRLRALLSFEASL
ncbi:MAG TPA: sigma-70 family RNA polymerase sigma factor [Candidatus Polarisedimenticolia bacterium]|nr:sigma-70 family RNA polymerase sigma factor [Candidatus Polarisedimenticolia bacterium]